MPHAKSLLILSHDKIHKLTSEEIKAKKIPPSRFVTDLSNGVAARGDKFLVWKWLGPLAKDYAKDLVQDSTAALMKLADLGESGSIVGNEMISFSLDVVALYDSLKHELVFEAIDDAVKTCRPDWDEQFCRWLKDMLRLSFDSAVVKFDAGNISVYFVLKKPSMTSNPISYYPS